MYGWSSIKLPRKIPLMNFSLKFTSVWLTVMIRAKVFQKAWITWCWQWNMWITCRLLLNQGQLHNRLNWICAWAKPSSSRATRRVVLSMPNWLPVKARNAFHTSSRSCRVQSCLKRRVNRRWTSYVCFRAGKWDAISWVWQLSVMSVTPISHTRRH